MDDTYAFPKDCHIMGMARIVELDAGRAVAENERGRVEILANDTFKNDSLNLTKLFKLNSYVAYKARKCQPNGRLSHVYVANYVKKVEDCFVGEATITELNKTYGHLVSKKHGKIFFNAQSFGDPSCDPYYANIRDCRLFFRQNDVVKYVAVTQGRFSTTLYALHFELLLNHQTMLAETSKKLTENNNDKSGVNLLPNLDLKLLPASNQIRLVGVIIDFDSKDNSCDVWVKRYGFLKLYPDDFDPKLVNMKNLKLILNIGDRVTFRFADGEIEDVKLLELDAKERLSLYLKDLPEVKKTVQTVRKQRKCILSSPDGRCDRYFAFPTPVRTERQRQSPADIIKTISQQSLVAAAAANMPACVEHCDDNSSTLNEDPITNPADHSSQESESISSPLLLDDEQVFRKEDEEEFMDKLSTYNSPNNKQFGNTFATNDDNFIFNTLFAYKPNNAVMTPLQTSSQPQQSAMISSAASCHLNSTAPLIADPFAINPTQELLSRMNLIQQSNSSKNLFLPMEKISTQIPRMPKIDIAAENDAFLRIPSPCPLGMLNYGMLCDQTHSDSSSSNTLSTLRPLVSATIGRQRQQTSPPSTDEGCFSLSSNSPPATTTDACVQTDAAFERMVIDTLTSHREIFEVIVAKEPELMYKWYTYRMMRPG